MWFIAFLSGLGFYFIIKVLAKGFYTVRPNERAVITSLGRAERLTGGGAEAADLSEDENERYQYPQVRVIQPGGPYFKWPWQEVHKVNVATQAADLTWDPTKDQSTIEAVTKDNLTRGQRTDSVPRQRKPPLCLPLRRSPSARACDGLLRLRAPLTHRHIRGSQGPRADRGKRSRPRGRRAKFDRTLGRGFHQRSAQEPSPPK